MAWDIRYRPKRFSDVLGQEGTVRLLKARLAQGTALSTSYVFAGGWGQGKTSLARVFARAALCTNLDRADPEPCNTCESCTTLLADMPSPFVELDASYGGTVDAIRSIVEDLPFAVMGGPCRIYLFDEAHRMSRDAQDVLLKPLEEKKMVGIFCTTESAKIRPTIRSRCEPYMLRKVPSDQALARVVSILAAENVSYEPEAVQAVIDLSGGHMRDVLNRLEMIAQTGAITLTSVREYLQPDGVEVFYKIVTHLGVPSQSVAWADVACDRMPVDDVCAGIADMAMAGYRVGQGVVAEGVWVDRAMAHEVWTLYGHHCLRIAEFFLRRRTVTKAGLLADLVEVAEQGAGQLPGGGGVYTLDPVAPRVVVAVPPDSWGRPTQTTLVEGVSGAHGPHVLLPQIDHHEAKAEAPPTPPTPPPVVAPPVSTPSPKGPPPVQHAPTPHPRGTVGMSEDVARAVREADDHRGEPGVPGKRPRGSDQEPKRPFSVQTVAGDLDTPCPPQVLRMWWLSKFTRGGL